MCMCLCLLVFNLSTVAVMYVYPISSVEEVSGLALQSTGFIETYKHQKGTRTNNDNNDENNK